MKIDELSLPITATKADWIPGTAWLGFTPTGTGPDARSKCQSTVNAQISGGLVLERVTQSFEKPRQGYESHPRVVQDRKTHEELKDRLIAIHQLRSTAKPLRQIVGDEAYEELQDIWSDPALRNRWSVAFPIVRSWEIVGKPKARDVLSAAVFRETYQSQNALLRPVSNRMRQEISKLEVCEISAPNVWLALNDEIAIAEQDNVPPKFIREMNLELSSALEGQSEERKVKLKRRAARMAYKYWLFRRKTQTARCDHCAFDPAIRSDLVGLQLRNLFDIHHKDPIAEGIRLTAFADLSLLCPTCHRIEHAKLRTRGTPSQ